MSSMQINTKIADILHNFCIAEGYQFHRDYSGRGMYGRRCIGISHDHTTAEMITRLALYLLENMGDDTIYSGTVAGATEGYLLGVPSFSVSLVTTEGVFFDTAVRVTLELVQKCIKNPLPFPVLLNINVPDVPYSMLKGKHITRLGRRHKAQPAIEVVNPRGETMYWVGPAGEAQDADKDTDFYAVQHDYVSMTPLQMDFTDYNQIKPITTWLDENA